MIEYLDAGAITEINQDVCAVSGENHQVLDLGGIENAAARPLSGTFDSEFYTTVYLKAGALLHAIASRQCFENGNKRTAWIAARTFLEINGVDLGDVQAIQGDAFVRAVAVDHTFAAKEAGEWFEITSDSRRPGYATDPRLEYLLLAGGAQFGEGGSTYSLFDAHVHTLTVPAFPGVCTLGLATRVHWRSCDAGLPHVLAAEVESDQQAVVAVELNHPWRVELFEPGRGGHAHHRDGFLPVLALMPLEMRIEGEGEAEIIVSIDGAAAGRVPIRIVHVAAEDGVLSLS